MPETRQQRLMQQRDDLLSDLVTVADMQDTANADAHGNIPLASQAAGRTSERQSDDNLLASENAELQRQLESAEARINDLARQLGNSRAQPDVNRRQNQPEEPEMILKSLQTPQILRDLPCFTGDPAKLHTFIKAIDNLMPILSRAKGSNVWNVWMQAIRSKITEEADSVLELYGTDLIWKEIKSTLITHFNDKRDEVSLTRDLFKLSQTGSVEEFYGKVSNILSLLINQLYLNETNVDVKMAKKRFYQETSLKVFLAGLQEPLGPIIRAQSPTTLQHALRLCSEESNFNYVKNHPKTQTPTIPPKPRIPMLQYPPMLRQPPPRPPNQFLQQKPFQNPRPAPLQFPPNRPFQFNPPSPGNAFQSNPLNRNTSFHRPIGIPNNRPMPPQADPSIRSKKINYTNRPARSVNYHEDAEQPHEYYNEYYAQNAQEYADVDPYVDNYYDGHADENPLPSTSGCSNTENKVEENDTDELNFQLVEKLIMNG